MQPLLDFEQPPFQRRQLLIRGRVGMGIIGEYPANAGTLSGGERIATAPNLRLGVLDRIPRHCPEQPILHLDETTRIPESRASVSISSSMNALSIFWRGLPTAQEYQVRRRYASTASAALRPFGSAARFARRYDDVWGKQHGMRMNRTLNRVLLCFVCLLCSALGLLHAQPQSPSQQPAGTNASPYKLEWQRHYDLQVGLVPVGTSDENGTLWLITGGGPGKLDDSLTKIDANGRLIVKYTPTLPLKPVEWVNYLSPATSGHSVGLLANVVSGGQAQTDEGAFFLPVGTEGLGSPVRIAGIGPQLTALLGADRGQFIAAGDQQPLTLVKLDSSGKVLWRRAFSPKLVLPVVSVGPSGNIFVVSQGGSYILLQILDSSGRVLRSKRIDAKQGTVVADPEGGCSILFSKLEGGEDNMVHLLALDQSLRQLHLVETPLIGWDGRSYQLISTPRGHLVIGNGQKPSPGAGVAEKIIAEFDRSGALIWQQRTESLTTPLLVPFRSGFYVVNDVSGGTGMDVEKYVY